MVDSRRCISLSDHRAPGPHPGRVPQGRSATESSAATTARTCVPGTASRRRRKNRGSPRRQTASIRRRSPGLLRLTPEEFRARTRQSAIRRAGYAGFLRNVAVALGNTGGPGAFEALEAALDHPEPLVRSHSAWGLAEVDGTRAGPVLGKRLTLETDPVVRDELEAALCAALPP